MFLAGDALLGERCSPALIAAAACSEDSEGDLGEGGLARKASVLVIEIRRGRCWRGEPVVADEGGLEVGNEFRSGAIVASLEHS